MDSARNGGNTLSWKVQSNTNDVMHSGESVDAIIQSEFRAVCFLGAIFFAGVVFVVGVVFMSAVYYMYAHKYFRHWGRRFEPEEG